MIGTTLVVSYLLSSLYFRFMGYHEDVEAEEVNCRHSNRPAYQFGSVEKQERHNISDSRTTWKNLTDITFDSDSVDSILPLNKHVASTQSQPNLPMSVSDDEIHDMAMDSRTSSSGYGASATVDIRKSSSSYVVPAKAKSLDFDTLSLALTKSFRYKGGDSMRRWYKHVYRIQYMRFKREERYERQAMLRYTIKRHSSRENIPILKRIQQEVRQSKLTL